MDRWISRADQRLGKVIRCVAEVLDTFASRLGICRSVVYFRSPDKRREVASCHSRQQATASDDKAHREESNSSRSALGCSAIHPAASTPRSSGRAAKSPLSSRRPIDWSSPVETDDRIGSVQESRRARRTAPPTKGQLLMDFELHVWSASRQAGASFRSGVVEVAIALAMIFVPLATWRLVYPHSDSGLLALGVLAAAVFYGSWRNAFRRRRAWLHAALQPASVLRTFLSGHLSASVAALCSTCAAIPAVAYFSLTSSAVEWWLIIGLALAVVLTTVAFRRAARLHVRPAFLSAVCTPPIVAFAGTGFAVIYVWIAYSVLQLPSYLDESSQAEALLTALAELPPRDHLAAEVLALFRSIEASALWALRMDEFGQRSPVLLFLLFSAFVCYGFSKVAAEITCLATEGMENWEHARGES